MDNRWHMNRMGFVNFWLYDEETFSFADGKLLLRGQNGSGKSITTQSFIPFILDGDRSPSRLDPFGSSDRRMEYYFLGESGKDESTGYLFLEFKREHSEQYRTIGIGQRAQKGKPLAFWGFVILDGRRIGYDMNLYREAGQNKIPCTKQELKNLLGEGNQYTEVQRDYMELVNKYIFGFASTEQYNQFIRLLIKVRAPKLSKEFKPTKVYEILNESLPTLSDEDLRAMVEAMEKMDDIQSRLEQLRGAYKDLQIIRNEYLRYNRYMLGKKAQAYVEEKKKSDGFRSHLEKKEKEVTEKSGEIRERTQAAKAVEDEIYILKKEKETLHVEDLETSVEKLGFAKEERKEAKREKEKLEERIEESRENIRVYEGNLHELQGTIDLYLSEAQTSLQELEEEDQIIQFGLHNEVKKIADARERKKEFQEFYSAIRQLEMEVQQGCQALRELQEMQEKWDKEEEKLQKLLLEKSKFETQYKDAELLEHECRDKIIEQLYILADQNQELQISKAELGEIVSKVQKYETPGDFGEIREIIYQSWQKTNGELVTRRLHIESSRKAASEEKRQLLKELEEIQNMRVPTPKQTIRTEETRKRLKEKGIAFLPFFEAVEFAENADQETRSRIECQLADAGILDALVIPEEQYEQAKNELRELSDVLIRHQGSGENRYPYLTPADIGPELKEETERILCTFYENDQAEAHFVLAADGYFKNGVLEGYSHTREEASYVGAAARKRKKEKMLLEKKEEIGRAEETLIVLEKDLEQIIERIALLKREYESMPSFADLDQAIDLLHSTRRELETCTKFVREQELETLRFKDLVRKCEQQVIKICRPLPYARKAEAYQEALDSVKAYQESLGELERTLSYLDTEKSSYSNIRELVLKEEERIDTDFDYIRRTERKIRELDVQIQGLQEYLDNPQIKEMAQRLGKIKTELEEKGERFQEHQRRLAVLESDVNRLTGEIEELKKTVDLQIGKEDRLRKYFSEELALELVTKQEEDSVYETAVRAQSLVREGDRQRSGAEMTTALMKTFHAHLSTLNSYGTAMEECFENEGEDSFLLRTRQRIVSTWNGKKLYLEEFYQVIKDSIENTELLIQQKDRELFEGILADTLSRKLSSRIRESRNWIKDMSLLMKEMDTSMALTFSLDWKPKAAEGEQELDTQELEKILARERDLLTEEDMDKVSAHFRTKIYMAKQSAEENGDIVNYMDLVRDALDYRKWFEFRMNYYRNSENKKELTNGAFNRFSGGEKAMAMYVPLFAAVSAQYKKAQNQDHPRIIALDEAFAGVDDKNINSMFALVQKLDFDYIMNSQVLWGCYETVKSLRIAELLRPANADVVTVIYYYWNGRERMLDEQ